MSTNAARVSYVIKFLANIFDILPLKFHINILLQLFMVSICYIFIPVVNLLDSSKTGGAVPIMPQDDSNPVCTMSLTSTLISAFSFSFFVCVCVLPTSDVSCCISSFKSHLFDRVFH